jgi:meiotically up-regulated gene 157 (Mug157) protein
LLIIYGSRTIYQLFIPANMMFSRYLNSSAAIMTAIGEGRLAGEMQSFAANIQSAISKYGIVNDPKYGDVYAYEVDGFGSGESFESTP